MTPSGSKKRNWDEYIRDRERREQEMYMFHPRSGNRFLRSTEIPGWSRPSDRKYVKKIRKLKTIWDPRRDENGKRILSKGLDKEDKEFQKILEKEIKREIRREIRKLKEMEIKRKNAKSKETETSKKERKEKSKVRKSAKRIRNSSPNSSSSSSRSNSSRSSLGIGPSRPKHRPSKNDTWRKALKSSGGLLSSDPSSSESEKSKGKGFALTKRKRSRSSSRSSKGKRPASRSSSRSRSRTPSPVGSYRSRRSSSGSPPPFTAAEKNEFNKFSRRIAYEKGSKYHHILGAYKGISVEPRPPPQSRFDERRRKVKPYPGTKFAKRRRTSYARPKKLPRQYTARNPYHAYPDPFKGFPISRTFPEDYYQTTTPKKK